jgi:hypothetical protein
MPAVGEASDSSAASAAREGGAGDGDAVAPNAGKAGAHVSRMSWMLDAPPLS